MDVQTRTRLDDVLQHLSLNGYSVFSLIDDILTRSDKRSNLENESIKLLREGLERDAADICARLLSHEPVSAFVSHWAFDVVQAKMRLDEEETRKARRWRDSDSEGDSEDEVGDPRSMWNNILDHLGMSPGNSQCTCSTTNVGLVSSAELPAQPT
jgi:hypothetical protein